MRRFTKPAATTLFVVALLGTTLGVTVGTASATVPAASKAAYCKAVLKVGTDVTPSSGTTVDKASAKSFQKAFTKLAKLAPTSAIKKQNLTIAAYYGKLANGDTPADIGSKEAEAFGKAFAKFGQYAATECISASIPDITLPGGGKVEIPGG
jgi:hypothetical protein